LDSGVHIFITFGGKLAMEVFDAVEFHDYVYSGTPIAMMFAQKEHHIAARDPDKQRGTIMEAVLEVDGESEILDKELPRLRDIEHT
jgi:hypothetical protein